MQTTIIKCNRTTITYRYFISNLNVDAETILKFVRNQWGIENLCHRYLDLNFDSDRCTIKDNIININFSIIKDFALSLLLHSPSKESIKFKRIYNIISDKYFSQNPLFTRFFYA